MTLSLVDPRFLGDDDQFFEDGQIIRLFFQLKLFIKKVRWLLAQIFFSDLLNYGIFTI